MGKRKMHGLSYYQCDWTGFPMRNSNCYLPDYRDGVLQKRGHYCNWEAVQAHIYHMWFARLSLPGVKPMGGYTWRAPPSDAR